MTNISTTTKCQISGTLEKIIYKNEENGFIVFSLQVNSQKTITVSGKQVFLNEGELLEIEGEWVNHTKFGRQFKAQKIRISLPSSTEGIKKYLGSSLIKGIGPKFAEKLVSRFKEKTLEVIEKTPDQLFEVEGIGEKRV